MPAASRQARLSQRGAAGLFAPLLGFGAVGVAVSGGADSTALMLLLARWRATRRTAPRLHVFTVDHALRPAAAGEAKQVARWAAALGLPHQTLRWQGAKPARNVQAAARAARYRLLAEACHAAGIPALLTAHHLDDQAETVLLRLMRGSGVDGLAAMAPRTDMMGLTVLRPLLDVPGARLRATLEAAGQGWIEDPSNIDERYARVRVRGMLAAFAGDGLDAAGLAETAKRMRRARAALDGAAAALARDAVTIYPAGWCALSRQALAPEPEEIGLRVVARVLMAVGGGIYRPRMERLERLYRGIVTGTLRHATLAGCKISLQEGRISVRREAGRAGLPEFDLEPGATALWDGRFHVSAARGAPPVRVRAVGADGWRKLKPLMGKGNQLPDAIRTSVSFWHGGDLLAAPAISLESSENTPFSAHFVGSMA